MRKPAALQLSLLQASPFRLSMVAPALALGPVLGRSTHPGDPCRQYRPHVTKRTLVSRVSSWSGGRFTVDWTDRGFARPSQRGT
jgi:hypothetical protein